MLRITRWTRRGGISAPLLLAAVLFHGPARATEPCPSWHAPPISAPQTARALQAGLPVVVVALGSSSTQGAMASNRGHSYPAELQAALASALPASHVSVLNRGVGGQDAVEELARLDRDVIAARPSLVIWQLGGNAVLRRTDPALFKQLVLDGVGRLHAAGADVVLMDNQRSPALVASPLNAGITRALAEAATETDADLFSRTELMAAWERGGHALASFLAPDGLHHNDHGYRCVAQALAASLVAGLPGPVPAHGQPAQVARTVTPPRESR